MTDIPVLDVRAGLQAQLAEAIILDECSAQILARIDAAKASKKAADRATLPGLRAELAANEQIRGAAVIAMHYLSPVLMKLRELEAARD